MQTLASLLDRSRLARMSRTLRVCCRFARGPLQARAAAATGQAECRLLRRRQVRA